MNVKVFLAKYLKLLSQIDVKISEIALFGKKIFYEILSMEYFNVHGLSAEIKVPIHPLYHNTKKVEKDWILSLIIPKSQFRPNNIYNNLT